VIRALALASVVVIAAATASAQEWIPLTIRDGLLTFPVPVEGRDRRVGYDVLRHFVITLDLASMKAHVTVPATRD
jgi:hypothetical protein